MIKEIMKKFTGLRWPSLVRSAGLVKLGLVVLAGLTLSVAHAQPANDNFANAINLTSYGDTGSTTGSNVGATIQPGEQIIDRLPIVSSVWYKWTASTNETTEFDPTGSLLARIWQLCRFLYLQIGPVASAICSLWPALTTATMVT